MLLSFLAVIIKAFDNYVVWMTSEINIVLNHRQNFSKEKRISIHPFIVWANAYAEFISSWNSVLFETIARNVGYFCSKNWGCDFKMGNTFFCLFV